MRGLRAVARAIDAFQERVGRATAWLMFGMVVVVFTDVVLRYAFNRSAVWAQELEWHLFGLVYLLGAGYTMLYDEHVRVDILYSRFSPRRRAWFDFVLLFAFFFPSCIMIIVSSWSFVASSFAVREGSPDPGGIPGRWVLKSAILVGFSLLILQGISEAIKKFHVAMGWEAPAVRAKEIH